MILKRILLGIAVIVVTATSGYSQTAEVPPPAQRPPVTALKVDSKIVAVSAIVRGQNGQPVAGLTRNDFILKQDGIPQEISFFSHSSDLPLTLALMIDTSGSQAKYIGDDFVASRAFFPAVLTRPGDRAVLVKFDAKVTQLAAMTNSVATLQKQLELLSPPSPRHGKAARSEPSNPHIIQSGGTLLYDAICAVANYELSDQMGFRAMVILTDGGDFGSSSTMPQAVNAALSDDIVIYSLYRSSGDGPENPSSLRQLSTLTGGRFFEIGKQTNLEHIYSEIANEMRLQYEIGYQPPDSEPGKHHKIELKVKSMTVLQARQGYDTPK